jgi:hypothetical protein
MTSEAKQPGEAGRQRRVWTWAYGACVVLFLGAVARFYEPGTGFSSLIAIGSRVDPAAVPALRAVPRHIVEDSYGYDGTYYVQLALHPLLGEPALETAIDNPHYRARRILVPWMAWVLGAGHPSAVVQAYALVNVLCWVALAGLLWRWFPPGTLDRFVRWAGLLLSAGVCLSLRHAVVDGPGLLFVALALRLWERHREFGAAGALALAALTKETSLLAGAMFARWPLTERGRWLRAAVLGGAALLPLALWMGVVRLRFGPVADGGGGNFTLPLAGFAEKWAELLVGLAEEGARPEHVFGLLTAFSLLVQMTFLLARWRPAEPAWRIGVAFAGLMLFLNQPVWEGYPGAAARVLLPMTLAFNLLVPRTRAGLLLLVAGNLSVATGIAHLDPPPRDFYRVEGSASLQVAPTGAWYAPEARRGRTWRWAGGDAGLVLENRGQVALEVRIEGEVRAFAPRRIEIGLEGDRGREVNLDSAWKPLEGLSVTVPPGAVRRLLCRTDRPGDRPGTGDPRALTFALRDVRLRARDVPRAAGDP